VPRRSPRSMARFRACLQPTLHGMAAGAGRGAVAVADRRRLGHSGLYVSPLARGTAALCRAGQGTGDRAAALVRRFLDAGGNLIDVSPGEAAEDACGRALGSRRPDAVLAATAGLPAGSRGQEGGNGRKRIREACEATLRRLRTDYIDLYQIQADDPATPLEEIVSALDDLVRAGKVLYTGASGLPAYRLMKALSASERLARARFISFCGPYGLTARDLEREHLPLLAEEGLGFISAGSPLPGAPPGPRDSAAGAVVERAAGELGCTPGQLELAWLQGRPVTSVITDASSTARLEDSMAALSIKVPSGIAALLEHLGPEGFRNRS
jgi:aryl-alcohol dehydrogenase-like predicted oxidoreductase